MASLACSSRTSAAPRRRLFGVTVGGDFPFTARLPSAEAPAVLTLDLLAHPLQPADRHTSL